MQRASHVAVLILGVTLLVSCGTSESGGGSKWCGVRNDATARLEYCFERLETCESKHAVDGPDAPVGCKLLDRAWCEPSGFECYPSQDQCAAGVRATRSRPRERHDALTGKVTHIPPAGPNDPMPACAPAWPKKLIGLPE